MYSQVSLVTTNFFMEDFEKVTLSEAVYKPLCQLWYIIVGARCYNSRNWSHCCLKTMTFDTIVTLVTSFNKSDLKRGTQSVETFQFMSSFAMCLWIVLWLHAQNIRCQHSVLYSCVCVCVCVYIYIYIFADYFIAVAISSSPLSVHL
jgi:hypothetical protein